ncbi:MAG TPA: extracellular solute-binding protein [Nitrososphaeraceae archaeon]|nr:extracellular solute-binding protein [Nitrososphaeraceae archaeon]
MPSSVNSRTFLAFFLIFILLFSIAIIYDRSQGRIKGIEVIASPHQKQNVTLTALLEDQGDPARWKSLIEPAMEKLRERYPEMNIEINYTTSPYNQTRLKILSALEAKAPVDLVSLDQIWLGEFAEKGLLTDLTNFTEAWGRQPDWYQANWDGGVHKGKVYGIWAWTDVRGIWYWKDMLNEAGVDPKSLTTWQGYIDGAKKLNAVLRSQNIEGVHLTGADHSPDLWYPYLWMLGGDIVSMKQGHPTKGAYWYPTFNGSEGTRALNFIKEQIDAGILPQKKHYWGEEFLDRKFAVMIEALQHHIPITTAQNRTNFEQNVGFIPMFPVPNEKNQTSTLMGGWELAVPTTSAHKDLAWELMTIMLEPEILGPYLTKHANMPTQIPIGQGQYSEEPTKVVPYYNQLVSMIELGKSRPSIPEYPQIAEFIKEALDSVYYGTASPKQALDQAAEKSAKALGW